MQTYKNQLLSIYPLPEISFKKGLKYNKPYEVNCNKGLLVYAGNTCYADSVFMLLFTQPNQFIDNLVTNIKQPKTQLRFNTYLWNNQNKEYKIKNKNIISKENSLKYQLQVKENINAIYTSIKSGENNQKITKIFLQHYITQNILGNNYTPGREADPIPFLNGIFEILIDSLNVRKYIISITSDFIPSCVNQYFDYNTNKDINIIIVNIDRIHILGYNEKSKSYRAKYNNSKLTPDEFIETDTEKFILTGIITRTGSSLSGGHYTARLLCNNEWYFYNDIDSQFYKIVNGTYDEMLEHNDTTILSVVCLYQKYP